MEPKTPEEFLNWVANWVLDGDLMPEDNPPEDQYEYELENDEVYENYTTIVTTARRLAGKDN
jgi:hypothetical protein